MTDLWDASAMIGRGALICATIGKHWEDRRAVDRRIVLVLIIAGPSHAPCDEGVGGDSMAVAEDTSRYMDVPASDFDGAWKEALERFFEPFVAFFFPQVHAGVDWTRPVVFHDTTLRQVASEDPQGKQHVDKLVQVVRGDGQPAWVLVHIEIQSQHDADFPARMFRYHARIYDRDRRQVVSLAVLGDEDAAWRPDRFGYDLWGCDLAFRFPVVKLLDLDRAALETSTSIFAALTLIHRDAQETRGNPQARMQRKLDRYRRLLRQGHTPEDIRAILRLMEYVLRLPPDLARPTYEAMKQIEIEEVGMTLVTSFEEIGRDQGQRDLVGRLLTRKLGSLPEDVSARIASLDTDTVLALADALLDFSTLTDLTTWLAQQPVVPPLRGENGQDQST